MTILNENKKPFFYSLEYIFHALAKTQRRKGLIISSQLFLDDLFRVFASLRESFLNFSFAIVSALNVLKPKTIKQKKGSLKEPSLNKISCV
jgi:hypothetical protein